MDSVLNIMDSDRKILSRKDKSLDLDYFGCYVRAELNRDRLEFWELVGDCGDINEY